VYGLSLKGGLRRDVEAVSRSLESYRTKRPGPQPRGVHRCSRIGLCAAVPLSLSEFRSGAKSAESD
jgi:hypothetical protein